MATLTPHEDMAPSPRVEILVTAGDLDGDVETITVTQSSVAGEIEVRDAIERNAVGGFTVTDYEVPPGVSVTYTASQWDEDGVRLADVPLGSTQVDIDPQYVIVQDPLAPLNAVLVDAHPEFGATVARSRAMARYRVGTTTVALLGELSLLEDVPVVLNTRTLADADMLLAVLSEAPFLIRSMPNRLRLPQLFYAVTDQPTQLPVDVQYGGGWVQWSVTAQEVLRPVLDTVEAAFTYGYYKASFAGDDYGDTLLLFTTYLDSKLNPPPEA